MVLKMNNDAQLQALKDFASAENKELVGQLEEILHDVAKTGQYIFPWNFMKPLYAHKLEKVTFEFLNTNPPLNNDGTPNSIEIQKLNEFREELLESFDRFTCAPFTLQRVTELLTNPNKHYKKTTKFFRGLEKNIMVCSTMGMVSEEERTILKRHYDEIKNENVTEDLEQRPPLKREVKEESGSLYSKYIDYRHTPDTSLDLHDEREDVDVSSTTDNIDDGVNFAQGAATNFTDANSRGETLTNGSHGYNTNGEKPLDEHASDFREETLQSNEAME